MCRIATYLGPPILLKEFLLQPCHSLYYQSWKARELKEAVVCADGFGFAWRNSQQQLSLYRNVQSIWADNNLTDLANTLISPYWLANVRSATLLQDTTLMNTHPFKTAQLLFTHNGCIQNFHPKIKTRFHDVLRPAIQAEIQGNTDSEYIFALLRQQLLDDSDLSTVIPRMVVALSALIDKDAVLLNLILGDGKRFYVMRHAINGDCPSLYFCRLEDSFPNAILIASEPMTQSDHWQSFPEHSYTTISDNTHPVFCKL